MKAKDEKFLAAPAPTGHDFIILITVLKKQFVCSLRISFIDPDCTFNAQCPLTNHVGFVKSSSV